MLWQWRQSENLNGSQAGGAVRGGTPRKGPWDPGVGVWAEAVVVVVILVVFIVILVVIIVFVWPLPVGSHGRQGALWGPRAPPGAISSPLGPRWPLRVQAETFGPKAPTRWQREPMEPLQPNATNATNACNPNLGSVSPPMDWEVQGGVRILSGVFWLQSAWPIMVVFVYL